jgi:hypothetical protein
MRTIESHSCDYVTVVNCGCVDRIIPKARKRLSSATFPITGSTLALNNDIKENRMLQIIPMISCQSIHALNFE